MTEHYFRGPLAEAARSLYRSCPPDPWSAEEDAKVRQPDAIPLCIHCLHPQEDHWWFCPNCDYPTGTYVALMPYLSIFLEGELLIRGVSGPPEESKVKLFGFVFVSTYYYHLFAPVYWYRMVLKQKGRGIPYIRKHSLEFEEAVDGDTPKELDTNEPSSH